MRCPKIALIAVAPLLVMACDLEGVVDDPQAGEDAAAEASFEENQQKSRDATRNGRMASASTADGEGEPQNAPGPMSGSSDASTEASYEASCEEVTADDGTLIITCEYPDATCVEKYDPNGDFISWECGIYGSYVCADSEEGGRQCTFDDGQGFVCTEVFDDDWSIVTTDCPWESEPTDPTEPVESCEANDDGSVTCTYDDAEWECTYLYAEDGVFLSADCSGAYGTATCAGGNGQLTCNYAYTGYEACTEVYAENDIYGILSSDCDWDLDGEPDCITYEGEGTICAYTEAGTECSYGFDPVGEFSFQDCTYDGQTYNCVRVSDAPSSTDALVDMIECSYEWEGEQCVDTYDLAFEFVSSTCFDETLPVDPPEEETPAPEEDVCALAWVDENGTCRTGNDGIAPEECCDVMEPMP
jgi:hypothetical protein